MAEPLTFFFCIGTRKTGTTILARALDQHPDIACMMESYALIPPDTSSIFYSGGGTWKIHGFDGEKVRKWEKLWIDWFNLPSEGRWLDWLKFPRFIIFRTTFTEVLTDFASRCKVKAVGDKWPFYVMGIHDLISAFPYAKLIYNVRDPRAVWNSGQNFRGREQGDVILDEMLDADERIQPFFGYPNLITLRYEDMISNPEKELKRLYEFLGCDYSPEYLEYDPAKDPYPQRWNWVPQALGNFDKKHTEKWREQMDSEKIKEITEKSISFIERYNYRI